MSDVTVHYVYFTGITPYWNNGVTECLWGQSIRQSDIDDYPYYYHKYHALTRFNRFLLSIVPGDYYFFIITKNQKWIFDLMIEKMNWGESIYWESDWAINYNYPEHGHKLKAIILKFDEVQKEITYDI